jgi:hypothetical protein
VSGFEKELTIVRRDLTALGKQLYIYLRHFPKAERYTISNHILSNYYKTLEIVIEFELRYHKKTSGQNLHITVEMLKSQILLAHDLGLFNFHNKTTDNDVKEEGMSKKGIHRFSVLSRMVSLLSENIGALIIKVPA